MTISKSIAVAGLIAAVSATAIAAPTVKLMTGGAKSGQKGAFVVQGIPSGSLITGAVLDIQFNDAKVAIATTSADYVAGPGWVVQDKNVSGNKVSVALSNSDGQSTDGPIVTISALQNGTSIKDASTITILPTSTIADADFNSYNVGPLNAAFLPGTTRNLGGTISGAVSVGPGGNVAAAVTTGTGTTLKLVGAADLADVAGFTAVSLGGTVSGRPSFGVLAGTPVIAVGDSSGKLTVVDASTGATVGTQPALTGDLTTPLIDAQSNIFVGATDATTATLHKINAGADTPITLQGAKVKTSPIAMAQYVGIGTDTAFQSFRPDGTPQSTIPDAAGFSGSPIGSTAGDVMIASAAATPAVYQYNLLTGSVIGSAAAAPAGAGPLTDPWMLTDGSVVYGGQDGKLYAFTMGATGPTAGAATALVTDPIATQPIQVGGDTYAVSSTGELKSTGGVDAQLGAPGTRALGATGRTAGTDSLIVATTDGTVAALPF